MKFHDGCDFNADAVVWNFDKLLERQVAAIRPEAGSPGPFAHSHRSRPTRWSTTYTVEIRTNTPDAFLPYQIAWVMMSSPAQWEKVGKRLEQVRPDAVGHRAVEAHALRAADARRAGAEQGLLGQGADSQARQARPAADSRRPTTRTAALRSGQVDWIEAPSPDAVPSLEKAGFKIVTNAYPHNWTWHLSRVEGSPWNDIRVRKAANLAIDRDGLKELLNGLMIPAKGFVAARQSVVRPSDLRGQIRSGGGQEAAGRSRLRPGQAGQRQDPDLGLGLGPDAAAADERIHPAEPRRGRHQGRLRRGRVEHDDQHVARRAPSPRP